jgi:hypothetical protein
MEFYSAIKKNEIMAQKMDGTGDHYVKDKRQILHIFSHMESLDLKKTRK